MVPARPGSVRHCPYRHLVRTRVAFELYDTVYALAKAGGFTRSHVVRCLVIPGDAAHLQGGGPARPGRDPDSRFRRPGPGREFCVVALMTDEQLEVLDRASMKLSMSRARYVRASIAAADGDPGVGAMLAGLTEPELQERCVAMLAALHPPSPSDRPDEPDSQGV